MGPSSRINPVTHCSTSGRAATKQGPVAVTERNERMFNNTPAQTMHLLLGLRQRYLNEWLNLILKTHNILKIQL